MSRYGPHDAATAPSTVTVLAAVHRPDRDGVEAPLPAALVKQRRDLNNRAWKADQ